MPNPAEIDFNDIGMCSWGQGTSDDPAKRDPDACPNHGTNLTEEGYVYCAEHIVIFYDTLKAIGAL